MIRFTLFLILTLLMLGTPAEAAHLLPARVWETAAIRPATPITPDAPSKVRLQAPLTIQIDDAESVELGPNCDLSLGLGNKAATNCTITIRKGKVIFDPAPPKR